MKMFILAVTVVVDDEARNAPSLEDVRLAVDTALSTPDNVEFGIIHVEINALEKEVGKL